MQMAQQLAMACQFSGRKWGGGMGGNEQDAKGGELPLAVEEDATVLGCCQGVIASWRCGSRTRPLSWLGP